MKYIIEYVKKKIFPGAWIGMNDRASKELRVKFKHKHPAHTVIVYSKVPKDVERTTLHHEEVEEYLMRVKHMKYHEAHKIALRYEDLDKPFSPKLVQMLLDRRRKKKKRK